MSAWTLGCGGGGTGSVAPRSPPPPSITISVTPVTGAVLQGETLTFTATVSNPNDTSVTWSCRGVNGVAGGNTNFGQICMKGSNPCQPYSSGNATQVDYVAPGSIPSPNPSPVTVTSTTNPNALQIVATSQYDSSQSGSAKCHHFDAVEYCSAASREHLCRGAGRLYVASRWTWVRAQQRWTGCARVTTCTRAAVCTAPVTSSDVAQAGNLNIQVKNPNAATSNTVQMVIVTPSTGATR